MVKGQNVAHGAFLAGLLIASGVGCAAEDYPERCGEGPWGDVERDADTIHVKARNDQTADPLSGLLALGSGTENDPFSTIGAGVEEAESRGGGRIAIATGEYYDSILAGGDGGIVEVFGRCPEAVHISGNSPELDLGLLGDSPETDGLTLTAGLTVLHSIGGNLVVEGVTVLGGDIGIRAELTGLITVRDSIFRRNQTASIFVEGSDGLIPSELGLPEAAVVLERVTFEDPVPSFGEAIGRHASVEGGGTLTVRDSTFDGASGVGLLVQGTNSSAVLEDVVVRSTERSPTGRGGFGVSIESGASLQADGLLLEGNHAVGLLVHGAGTEARVESSTVRGTLPEVDGLLGVGIAVWDGAQFVGNDLTVEENVGSGIFASSGSVAIVADSVVRGTTRGPDTRNGFGLISQSGSLLNLQRTEVSGNDGPGLYVVGGEASAVVRDVRLSENGFAGVVALSGAKVDLQGGLIEGSEVDLAFGGGVGVFAERPGALLLDAVSFQGMVGPALYARGPGQYVLRDCDVEQTGLFPSLPGGVFASDAVGPWDAAGGDDGTGAGLLLAGNSFRDLRGDAVLLDGASATLDEGDGPNVFEGLTGDSLWFQRCEDMPEPQVLDGSGAEPACREQLRPIGPVLDYRLRLGEVGALGS